MAYTIKGIEPATNPQLADYEATHGPSNLVRTMAHRPEAMQDFVRLSDALMGPAAVLDKRIREMVYLTVSYTNECSQCVAYHTRPALEGGVSAAEIRFVETENDAHFTPRERAALRYARELTRTASVSDDLRYHTEELFTTDEVVELTMIVGLANFTNRFNSALAVPAEL